MITLRSSASSATRARILPAILRAKILPAILRARILPAVLRAKILPAILRARKEERMNYLKRVDPPLAFADSRRESDSNFV